jgi:hypothetical protein
MPVFFAQSQNSVKIFVSIETRQFFNLRIFRIKSSFSSANAAEKIYSVSAKVQFSGSQNDRDIYHTSSNSFLKFGFDVQPTSFQKVTRELGSEPEFIYFLVALLLSLGSSIPCL